MTATMTCRHARKGALAIVALLTVAIAGIVPGRAAHAAAPGTVTGATFEWTFSDEGNAASFNGQCNFWSAGASDGTAATYNATNGNATVLKLNASNQYVPIANYANRCLDKNGAAVNFATGAAAKRLGQKVRFTNGAGTLDPTTGASTIQWTGTWSINFYGTAVPFWITNPKLVVDASGNGTVTAAMGGFASDINNPDVKVPLPAQSNVVIASLSGVAGANITGFSKVPNYSGEQYDVDPSSGQAPQNRVNAGWGAWPKSFVDFQMATGLGSYWYSSGGSIDPRKPPFELSVGYGTFTGAPAPSTTVSPNSDLNAAEPNGLTVNGSNFTGFAASESGVYVGLVPASKWQPGQVPNQADFVGTQFVPKQAMVSGAFTTTVTVPAGTAVEGQAYGVGTICAHGCAVTNRAYDSFTPVEFKVTHDPLGAKVGTAFSYTIPPFDGAMLPATFAVTGKIPLPAGLSLNATTGVISGTPASELKTTVRVKITDSKLPRGKSKTVAVKFLIAPEELGITPGTVPNATPNVAYPVTTLAGNGGIGPHRFKVTAGALPLGLRLSGKGVLAGKTKVTSGSFSFTVTAIDKLKFSTSATYTLAVDATT